MKIAQDIATRQESTIIPERVLRDLVVERWPIDRHIPYVRNARTHTEEQVAQVAASIIEFGWTNPILVGADGVIIAGHARLLAARKLAMTEVPVIVLDHLSETQRRALVLADNRLALSAGWDEEMLRPMPTPPPLWMLTQLAPAAVFTRALSSGQSAMASEPSRMPSVSRNGEATEPVSRWSRPITMGACNSPVRTRRLMARPNSARSP